MTSPVRPASPVC